MQKKLRGNERLTVSPLFAVSDGLNAPPLPFKMIMSSKNVADGKGTSFKMAKGHGIVQLKCEAPREVQNPFAFFLSVGTGPSENPKALPARGPVMCDFVKSGVHGLPKACEIWDFSEVVDHKSQTFIVCLEIAPCQNWEP